MIDWVITWGVLLWPWLLLAVHVTMMLVASGHAVLTKRDSRSAIGWVGLIWLAPILGSLLYFAFGINRLRRKARLLRGSRSYVTAAVVRTSVAEEVLERFLGDDGPHLAPLVKYVSRLTHMPLLEGNRITPLPTGRQAYDQMLSAIDEAQQTIGLMTYIFDNDAAGQMFVEALARAVARGVKVRVLIDDVGSRYTFPSIQRVLRRRGIPFATFLPTLVPRGLHYANLRNHRKILVVDGRLGFTGGMNIRQGHLCAPGDRHPIQDLHFRVEGPVVGHLAETFCYDWEFAAGEHLDGPGWFPSIPRAGHSLARGVLDGPDMDIDKIVLAIHGALSCARRSVEIVTPYFLPEQPLITALGVTALRGVAVHILIPQQNNLKLVEWACMAQLWQILQRGCRVWLTPPPFDHSKLMVVDGVWSLVGSANWDPRSLRLNFEFNLECYDRDLASQLSALVQAKRAVSREITLADVDSRPLWQRLRDGVCRLALPYL